VGNFLGMLRTSKMLAHALPDVRRLALMMTLAKADSSEDARHVLLENLCSSPYIPEASKNDLAELVYTEQWDTLRAALQCEEAAPGGANEARPPFSAFRAMVVSVFSRSRKMATVSAERRRQLGLAIYGTQSVDELKTLALMALQTSEVALSAEPPGALSELPVRGVTAMGLSLTLILTLTQTLIAGI
jgi:hypothetical protein